MLTSIKSCTRIRQSKWAITLAFCILSQCVVATAQTASNPNILIVPYGIWQVCESAWGAQSPLCSDFTPGSEQFLLLVKASRPDTTEYLYTIVATMQDGSTRAVSGQLKRNDNGAGYSQLTLFRRSCNIVQHCTVEEAIVRIPAVQQEPESFDPENYMPQAAAGITMETRFRDAAVGLEPF